MLYHDPRPKNSIADVGLTVEDSSEGYLQILGGGGAWSSTKWDVTLDPTEVAAQEGLSAGDEAVLAGKVHLIDLPSLECMKRMERQSPQLCEAMNQTAVECDQNKEMQLRAKVVCEQGLLPPPPPYPLTLGHPSPESNTKNV